MSKIVVLSETLASQVAAGEVVERPASVLKELIENSLDAQATQIEIEVRRGGVALLKISDNGVGMNRADAELCLERHATSKLKSVEGLSTITTHGFRGEAIPSIASVSRFKLITNDDPHTQATELLVQGVTIVKIDECARAKGTTIEVKDLFYNVPARRKFLKSEATEYAHIEHVIKLSALGNPKVRYLFKNNGRTVWDLSPSSDRRARIANLTSIAIVQELKEVELFQHKDITISGYILPGKLARGTGKSQTVFINGRPIDDPVIRSAIRDGYHGHIQQGQYPVVWLWITMPPKAIDVNVHPAKREVRFAKPMEIKQALYEALVATLKEKKITLTPKDIEVTPAQASPSLQLPSSTPKKTTQTPPSPSDPPPSPTFALAQQWATPEQEEITFTPPPTNTSEESSRTTLETKAKEQFKLLGELKKTHWLFEDESGLMVFSPKAAQERILYEKLKKDYTEGSLEAQTLLFPLLLELDSHDKNTVTAHLLIFNELGIEIESFGGATFQVLTLPTLLEITQPDDAQSFVMGLIDSLESSNALQSAQTKERALEDLIISVAQQQALHQRYNVAIAYDLLNTLLACELPYCDARGRPTMTHYSMSEIIKKFT